MRHAAALLIIPLLAGCASAVPGYTPESGAKIPVALQPFKGGAVDDGGHYVVSTAERALTCPKITGSMQIIMSRLKDSGSRPQPSAISATMQSAAKPIVGPGADLNVAHEIRQARARLKAYNELLVEKKCKTLDIAGV